MLQFLLINMLQGFTKMIYEYVSNLLRRQNVAVKMYFNLSFVNDISFINHYQ